jgi:hypothetical protein
MLKASRAHLAEVDETYFTHLAAALRIAGILGGAALACAVHAIVPALFTRTASRRVEEVRSGIATRTRNAEHRGEFAQETGASA